MINDDLSKDEWCEKFCEITATYDIHIFRKLIRHFCLRLIYNEKAAMSKSSSSALLVSIHDVKPNKENIKQQSSSMIDNQSNIESFDNESVVDEDDIDESSSNSNNYSSANDSSSEDNDFDVYSNQFIIKSKHTNNEQTYACDPIIYHLLNHDRIYTHNTNSDPKKEYYNKKYSDDQILAINEFKRNILSFISEFNIKKLRN